jgi:hypothetical protein
MVELADFNAGRFQDESRIMMTETGELGDYQVTLPSTFSKKEYRMSDVTVYRIPRSSDLRPALFG